MFFHRLYTLQTDDDTRHAEVRQWARLEGKSDSMAADLVQASHVACRQRTREQPRFCPRCFACAAGGAVLAIAVERLFFAG